MAETTIIIAILVGIGTLVIFGLYRHFYGEVKLEGRPLPRIVPNKIDDHDGQWFVEKWERISETEGRFWLRSVDNITKIIIKQIPNKKKKKK